MSQIKCPRCGATAELSSPCPMCGAIADGGAERARKTSCGAAIGLGAVFVLLGGLAAVVHALALAFLLLPLLALSWALLPQWRRWFGIADAGKAVRIHAILTAILLVAALVGGVYLSRFRRSQELEQKKAEVLEAAKTHSLGAFRMAFKDAVAWAETESQSEWLESLRVDLEAQWAADSPEALRRIGEREKAGSQVEALTDWKGLWEVLEETPPAEARTRHEDEWRAVGIRLAHGLALADLAAGRWSMALLHHADAGALCGAPAQADTLRKIHDEMAARLREWLASRAQPIADAVADGSDRKLAAAGAPVADVLAAIRQHDTAGCKGRWDANLATEFEHALAAIPTRRVVVRVQGDPLVAQRVRSLCQIGFPYVLEFAAVAEGAEASESAEPGAWATVLVNVEWTWTDYSKQAGGVQFAGDYTLPDDVTLSCSVQAPEDAKNLWPTKSFTVTGSAPKSLKLREDSARYDFDRLKREYTGKVNQALREYLDAWKPWVLPDPG